MSYHKILELMKDTPQYSQRRKVISANSDNEYVVSIRKRDNRWACSCKGWIFVCQKKGTDCQHIEEIKRIYGNKATANGILLNISNLTASLKSKKMDPNMAVEQWCAMKDNADMLLFYYENTPEEANNVEPTRQAIEKAKTLIVGLV